jgi:TonB family protein
VRPKALLVALLGLLIAIPAVAANEMEVGTRHVRHYLRPSLPEIARKMNLKGSVKLEVQIGANGKVTSVKPLGGHPLLVQCASDAVRAWQFEPSDQATTGPVVIDFQ